MRNSLVPSGESKAETVFLGRVSTLGIYDLVPQTEKEAEGKGGKGQDERSQEEGQDAAVSPLASPKGLKEAVGVTVLVESMKLREAQKMPERTLLSSFHDSSTLDGDKKPLTVPGLRLPPRSEPAAGCQAMRPASCWSRNCPSWACGPGLPHQPLRPRSPLNTPASPPASA